MWHRESVLVDCTRTGSLLKLFPNFRTLQFWQILYNARMIWKLRHEQQLRTGIMLLLYRCFDANRLAATLSEYSRDNWWKIDISQKMPRKTPLSNAVGNTFRNALQKCDPKWWLVEECLVERWSSNHLRSKILYTFRYRESRSLGLPRVSHLGDTSSPYSKLRSAHCPERTIPEATTALPISWW